MVRSVPQPAPSLRSGVAAGERCLCGALAGFGCRPPERERGFNRTPGRAAGASPALVCSR